MSGILALWADDAPRAAATLAAVGRHGAPPMSVQGRILVLGHLGEAQYRLGDWDAAAANGALAVSLVRDAGVLLGAGAANALAAHVAAGRGAWDTAEERVATAALAAELLPWWGARAHAATARASSPRPAATTRRCSTPWRSTTTRPSSTPSTALGVLPWRALRVEALLGRRPDRRGAGRARRAGGAGGAAVRPGWSALEAARLRCEIAETRAARRRGAPGVRTGDDARGDGAGRAEPRPPRDRPRPVPARGRRAPPRRRPAADRPRAARAGSAPRRSSTGATRCCAPPACTRPRRAGPSSSPRRSSLSPAWSPRAARTRRPARRCSSRAGPSRST